MSRPVRSVVVLVMVGGLLVVATLAGAFVTTSFAASEDDTGVELLTRARDAATGYDFTGEVVVEWRGEGRVHRERVPVRADHGVLRVGEQRKIMGAGDDRLLARDGVWKRLWAGPSDSTTTELAAVDPERKYTLAVSDGPRTAGRPTTLVEIGRGGTVSERFAVDDETGLLLRREQLDRRGRLERAVRFVELSEPEPTPAPDPASRASAPKGQGPAPKVVAKASNDSAAPRRLGDGFLLTGRYRAADGTMHFFYSDGIYAVSVFEQDGELDRGELPDDAASTEFAGRRLTNYATPSGTVVVWAGDDRVFTLVSDAPKRDLDAMVRDLPAPSEADTATVVARFVLSPFRW